MSDNQFKCPPCGEEFNSKEELVLHAQNMHSKKEEQQQEHSMMCSKCGLKAKTADEKAQHSCAAC